MITTSDILRIYPGANKDRIDLIIPHLNKALDAIGENSRAMFVAQTLHESSGYSRREENLNYSAAGLANTWPKRFGMANGSPNKTALGIARKPQAIANFAYANRMGNGDENSGDGWKYRGRGIIQITGRDAYAKCGEALKIDLVGNPDMLLEPEYACMSAAWYWNSRGLDQFSSNVEECARRINGGFVGISERKALYVKAVMLLQEGKKHSC